MSKQIKLTFNQSGIVTVTSDQIRQGDADVKLVASFEGKNNANYVARYTFTRPDGKIVKGLMNASSTATTDYEKVLDSAYYFAVASLNAVPATLTVFLFSGDQVLAQGQASIPVEQTDFSEETTITPDEYNELLELIATKLNIQDGIMAVDSESSIVPSEHTNGQVFYVLDENKIIQLVNNNFTDIVDLNSIPADVDIAIVKASSSNLVQLQFKNANGDFLFAKSFTLLGANETQAGLLTATNQNLKGVKTFADLPQTKEGRVYNNDRQLTDKGYVGTAIADMKTIVDAEIAEITGDYFGIEARVATIEDVIPSEASSNNKLVDRDTMNSTISGAAAFFRGNFSTKADLTSKAWQSTNPSGAYYVTNNDYAVVNADESHSGQVWRYKYTITALGGSWNAEYKVNDAPFTSDQIKAINSGATDELIEQIGTNKEDIELLVENKLDTIEAEQKYQSKIVSVDITIEPEQWSEEKTFTTENIFGTLGFVNNDDTYLFLGISRVDDAVMDTFNVDVTDVASPGSDETYAYLSCDEVPTESVSLRINLIKKNNIIGSPTGYVSLADLDGETIEYSEGKVRVIGQHPTDIKATEVEVTTTHTSVQANIIRIDGEINRVEEKIPDAPSEDGNYTLKCSVVGGVKTYAWVKDE